MRVMSPTAAQRRHSLVHHRRGPGTSGQEQADISYTFASAAMVHPTASGSAVAVVMAIVVTVATWCSRRRGSRAVVVLMVMGIFARAACSRTSTAQVSTACVSHQLLSI